MAADAPLVPLDAEAALWGNHIWWYDHSMWWRLKVGAGFETFLVTWWSGWWGQGLIENSIPLDNVWRSGWWAWDADAGDDGPWFEIGWPECSDEEV